MSTYIAGIEDRYPKPLLSGRPGTEGNVISCLFRDMLLLDDIRLDKTAFITKDGRFYYGLVNSLREKGFTSLDEITVMSGCSDEVLERYEERGGWETIQHQSEIINLDNFDTYVDILRRENIILNLYDDGFNLTKEIEVKGKKTTPLKLFRKLSSEDVLDWYETRLCSYGGGYASRVTDEEEIDFDEDFIADCKAGLENGIPFDTAGGDINGNPINCFPFLSDRTMGLPEGTLTMLGGFSSAGKSTWWITPIMSLLHYGRKVLIISNEERAAKFKTKFMTWLLAKWDGYYKLTKKKLMCGDISDRDDIEMKKVEEYWRRNYKGRIKFISINEADMTTVKKKIRENVLRYGYDTVLYDTFKIQCNDMTDRRQDLALVRDSRDLDRLAKKYNIIMLASVQLAEGMKGKLFLDSSVLSNSKQIKEVLEGLFLIRNVYDEELDPKSKYYCRPFRLKKINDKWIEEEYTPDPSFVWKMLFVEKSRNGANSSDTGTAYLLRFLGDFAVFKETAQCRPRHGTIT